MLLTTSCWRCRAERAGGIAWEYYFDFDGGRPPWVSGLAQGTGLQAIARAAVKLGRGPSCSRSCARALGIFRTPPPEGVRTEADGGLHYLQYSFAPGLQILNGFVQSLVGLYDYAALTADPEALQLYGAGLAAARVEVPASDTGAWSLYSRGTITRESDLTTTGCCATSCSRCASARPSRCSATRSRTSTRTSTSRRCCSSSRAGCAAAATAHCASGCRRSPA